MAPKTPRPLIVDVPRRLVTAAGKPLKLPPREFDLLVYLAGRRERVVQRWELLKFVWKHPTGHDADTRTVDQHLSRLRRKIGKGWIETRVKYGYGLSQAGRLTVKEAAA